MAYMPLSNGNGAVAEIICQQIMSSTEGVQEINKLHASCNIFKLTKYKTDIISITVRTFSGHGREMHMSKTGKDYTLSPY